MKRVLFMFYAILCYLAFLATFFYAIGFVTGIGVPTTLDGGAANPATTPFWTALAVDAALLTVFALQHSVMARKGFKEWWTKIVPKPIERSTYVLFASAALALLFWQWRPLGGTLWNVTGAERTALLALSMAGWLIVFISTWLTSHWDLFGLRQAWLYVTGKENAGLEFTTRGFYRFVRHPIYLGFTIAFWATPHMTVGHLVFAVATLAYMLVAIQLEERDLVRIYGDAYRAYRERVSMLVPLPPAVPESGEKTLEEKLKEA
ncbi:MAG: methanethiol S-methyltransferase [Gemmatimonadota bacterium]